MDGSYYYFNCFYLTLFYFNMKFNLKADTCDLNKISFLADSTQPTCPDQLGSDVTLAFYVVYMIIINLLLLNLLIAIFT